MRRDKWLIMAAAAFAAGAALAQGEAKEERLVLPSGLAAHLQEVIRQDGPVLRFRFVAPGFDRAAPLETVSADLEFLCNAYALPRLPAAGANDARIVVSLGDKPSAFGVSDPDVAQVFEAYRVENGTCIWEVF